MIAIIIHSSKSKRLSLILIQNPRDEWDSTSFRLRKSSLPIFSLARENYRLPEFLYGAVQRGRKSTRGLLRRSPAANKSLFKLPKLRAARQHFSYFGRRTCPCGISEGITRARAVLKSE